MPIIINQSFPVTTLTLNRPEKRNALDGELIEKLISILQQLSDDEHVHLVVINGAGNHFCAGADIAWMKQVANASYEFNKSDAMQLARLLKLIYTFPKPVIAAIQGATMGGGLGVIACCDIVIAAENAHFCFSEAKIGLTPSVISPYIVSLIGERAARYYFLTAEKFNVQEALRLNLVQRVVPISELSNATQTLVEAILKNSPNALTQAKMMIQRVRHESYSDRLIEFTAEHLAKMRTSQDAQEGIKAFLEKRTPTWS